MAGVGISNSEVVGHIHSNGTDTRHLRYEGELSGAHNKGVEVQQ
jgi:hypothetical protein